MKQQMYEERLVNIELFNGKEMNPSMLIYTYLLEVVDTETWRVPGAKVKERFVPNTFSNATYYRVLNELKEQEFIDYGGGEITLLKCKRLKSKGMLPMIHGKLTVHIKKDRLD